MKTFRFYNLLFGWATFLVTLVVYTLTVEPTSSLWDCGEFIAGAYKLQVGHPPGAPVFMLIGRIFSLFTSDVTKVALMINMISVLASAFTILFLFWSVTHLGRKMINMETGNIASKYIAVIGSGVAGALAYAFSDTFWFSGVEGEVYAFSSLFTAVVFWAILKWENTADEKYANKWLVLIAYLMGLSIGVHLLNLLAIPAIIFVYYFRKYKVTSSGVMLSILTAGVILGTLIYIIIPGLVWFASKFELFFVNELGASFNSGIIIYILLLIAGIVIGLFFTNKYKKYILNTAILCFTMIIIGYSSYMIIVIRSLANPPMDENSPDTVFALQSYLNREQYGDRPLMHGQYFNARPIDSKEGKPFYTKGKDKYIPTNYKTKYIYDDKYTGFFPRMWSSDQQHVDVYMEWGRVKEKDVYKPRLNNNSEIIRNQAGEIQYDRYQPKERPTFIQNMRFFVSYQIGFMYFRYFMWNFAGRQNDIQGYGGIQNGNWLSGIKGIDSMRLGNQMNMPDEIKNHHARNTYYFLPLILGLIGLIYHYIKNKKDFWVVLILFALTGAAIVVYLNQTPNQPRERDYAYAGSFYAFAIWIGLGVMALIDTASNLKWNDIKKPLLYVSIGLVSLALLELLIKKGVVLSGHLITLFVVGAFMITLMRLIGAVLDNKKITAGIVLLISLGLPVLMAFENWNDHDRSGRYFARDLAYDYLNSCKPNAILFTNGDNDTFPLWYAQEVEGIRTDVRVVNLMLLNMDWYINQMQKKAYESNPLPMSLKTDQYIQGTRDVVYIQERVKEAWLKEIVDFIGNDDLYSKLTVAGGEKIDYVPTKNFKIPVDTAKVLANGTVKRKDADKINNIIKGTLSGGHITKSDLVVMDIIAYNNWERPIYFVSANHPGTLGLDDYFQLEGFAYRLVPIKSDGDNMFEKGRTDFELMYENLMNKFRYGNIEKNGVLVDHYVQRTLNIIRLRYRFAKLAEDLYLQGDNERSEKVLDTIMQLTPHEKVPYDMFMLVIAEQYFILGKNDKAKEILNKYLDITKNHLEYYFSMKDEQINNLENEIFSHLRILYNIINLSKQYKLDDIMNESNEIFKIYENRLRSVNS